MAFWNRKKEDIKPNKEVLELKKLLVDNENEILKLKKIVVEKDKQIDDFGRKMRDYKYLLNKDKQEKNKNIILPEVIHLQKLNSSKADEFILDIEKENIILKKLNTDKRSALFILKNYSVCERILNETPIPVVDFCQKYNFPKNTLNSLIKSNLISHFSNSFNKGRKVYIFEEELLKYNEFNSVNNFSSLEKIYSAIELYLMIAEKFLTARESNLILNYFFGKKYTLDEEITKTRIQQIQMRAIRRIKNYIANSKNYDLIENEINILTTTRKEIETFLKIHESLEEKKIILDRYVFDKISERLKNTLLNNGVDDLQKLTSLNWRDVKRMRGFGKKTFNELIEFCNEFNIVLEDC